MASTMFHTPMSPGPGSTLARIVEMSSTLTVQQSIQSQKS